ncbi:MAG: hypothetical protein NTY70_04825, partial [Burkholderiales bacterium]|nr:hypothetical protein [Burkholderiales bacterium]
IAFQEHTLDNSYEAFMQRYRALSRGLQHDLGDMYPTPIVSMAAAQVQRRENRHSKNAQKELGLPNSAASNSTTQSRAAHGQ